MPIEIRELHVKAIVGSNSTSSNADSNSQEEESPVNKEAIVAECVNKVLEILNLQTER